MILKNFYLDKKARIEAETCYSGTIPNISLYTESVFKNPITTPTVLFKYDSINWGTSLKENYKADTIFCIYIVLPLEEQLEDTQSCEVVFDIAKNIDKAILEKDIVITPLVDSNPIVKISENQYCNHEQYNRESSNYFIWEISYQTTLVKTDQKKQFKLMCNGITLEDSENLGYMLTKESIRTFASLEN